jgi:hypothetical protein
LREVYADESYIHKHYHRNDDSLWDPNDDQDVIYQKEKHKGHHYCFCAAILGPNPRVEATEAEVEDKAGQVPGSIWAFCLQKKGDHLGDYHKVFNGTKYIAWFCNQLIANLHQPSLIMLDNEAYHCVYGEGVPQWYYYKLKKQECIDYLISNSIDFLDPAMSAMEMKLLVKEHIASNVKIEVHHLAEKGGHTVLFTPAYNSDLQPIELVWARVKGNVGRQYSNQSTLDLVYEHLMHEFNVLENSGHHSINGMMEKCASLAAQFRAEIEEEDAIDDNDSADASDNASNLDQEDPPDPRHAANNGPGEQGGDDGSEQGEIGLFAMV